MYKSPVCALSLRAAPGIFLCLLAGLTTGCATLGYYGQAVAGQWQLLQARRSIPAVLADPATPERTRKLLALAQQARRFGVEQLHLPDNGNFRSYVDLGRPFVVWNVVATPPFSLKPLQNCFPVVGCLSYRGYFHPQDAAARAKYLRQRGYDVDVGTATAYSSLGWFHDPLLSSMLHWDATHLAGVMFHEMAHAKLYVPNDTAFNEAFADTVQAIGTLSWLRATHGPAILQAYQRSQKRQRDFLRLVRGARQQLQALYGLGLTDPQELRRAKAEVFRQLRNDYQEMKRQRWHGYNGYDEWFAGSLNNAKLALLGTYQHWVPALRALYRRKGSDLVAFYRACAALGRLSRPQREQQLRALQASCPAADRGGCAAFK